MNLDIASIALLISAVATAGGLVVQGLQSLSMSSSERQRTKVEEHRAQAEGIAQTASALQTMSNVSQGLLDRFQAQLSACEEELEQSEQHVKELERELITLKAQVIAMLDMLIAQIQPETDTPVTAETCSACIFRNPGFVDLINQLRQEIGA